MAEVREPPKRKESPPPEPKSGGAAGEELERLRSENLRLSSENRLLQAHVAEPQQTAAREVQRHDRVQARVEELQQTNQTLLVRIDELNDWLNDRAKANDRLQSILIDRVDGRLRMAESYQGVVEDVQGDRVVVVYDVNDNVVEQTYERSQFIGGRLPEVDTRLVVYVNVAEIQEPPAGSGAEGYLQRDEHPATRREVLSGPTSF
jgi:hypothetical protein